MQLCFIGIKTMRLFLFLLKHLQSHHSILLRFKYAYFTVMQSLSSFHVLSTSAFPLVYAQDRTFCWNFIIVSISFKRQTLHLLANFFGFFLIWASITNLHINNLCCKMHDSLGITVTSCTIFLSLSFCHTSKLQINFK